MSLPRPIVTNNDIAVIWHIPDDPISLKWNILSNDPIKLAVFRAILSCKVGLNNVLFDTDMSIALSKNGVCFIHSVHWKWGKCITEMFSDDAND